MSYRAVIHALGMLLLLLSGAMLFPLGWAVGEWLSGRPSELEAAAALGGGLTVALATAGMLVYLGRGGRGKYLGRREALLLVSLGWLVGALIAAVPYYLWAVMVGPEGHPFHRPVDCWFESVSGLTTTGASILSHIELLPRGILLWRSMTQWLGGLGIVVLFVAVLPSLGVGGKKLFAMEMPGGAPSQSVRPRIAETARVLWLIYLTFSVVCFTALWLSGTSVFDAVAHTFTTLATGGFSPRSGSVADLDSAMAEGVIILFMILAGTNFALFYLFLRRGWRSVVNDPEWRLYLAIMAIATAIITFELIGSTITTLRTDPQTGEAAEVAGGLLQSLRYAAFQVAALQTSTGYATADYDQWTFLSRYVLILLMFIGGCSASTGGGIKVIRVLMAFKVLWTELERIFRPNVVRPVRIGRSTLTPEMKQNVLVHLFIVALLVLAGVFGLSVFEHENPVLKDAGLEMDLVTAVTATISAINIVGPAMGMAGPTENYGWMTDASKLMLTALMVLGRLEIFTILVLIVPRFWRTD